MSDELEVFLLYYTAWHEGEYSLVELKGEVISEIGTDGLKKALTNFRSENEKRYKIGDKRTYYEANK